MQAITIAIDLVAIGVLTFGLYFPRHRRRDLVVAFLGVNVGVLAVAATLASSDVGAGLGLGLFGVLSIIRLRSPEIDAARGRLLLRRARARPARRARGTAAAGSPSRSWRCVAGRARRRRPPAAVRAATAQQVIVLDRAFTDERGLVAHLEELLGARVHARHGQRLDLVNDTTLVDVRYRAARPARRPRRDGPTRRPVATARRPVPDDRVDAPSRTAARRPRADRRSTSSQRGRAADPRRPQVPACRLADLADLARRPRAARAGPRDRRRRGSFGYESVYFDTPDLLSYRSPRTAAGAGSRSAPAPTSTPGSAGSRSRRAAARRAPSRSASPYDLGDRDSAHRATAAAFVDGVLGDGRDRRHRRRPPRADPRHPLPAHHALPAGDLATAGPPSTPTWSGSTARRRRRSHLPGARGRRDQDRRAASAVDRLLWPPATGPAAISKYGTGLAALRPDLPPNKWRARAAPPLRPAPRATAAPPRPHPRPAIRTPSRQPHRRRHCANPRRRIAAAILLVGALVLAGCAAPRRRRTAHRDRTRTEHGHRRRAPRRPPPTSAPRPQPRCSPPTRTIHDDAPTTRGRRRRRHHARRRHRVRRPTP